MTTNRTAPPPPDRRAGAPVPGLDDDPAGVGDGPADPTSASDGIDLSSLSVAGITRRRVAWLTGGLVSAWIVIVFARQAGDAAGAAARVDQMNEDNRALAAEVASLEQELQVIEKPAYIAQASRAYRIGTDREVPFTLDSSVPSPAVDAPGSAALSLGAGERSMTPLESWLSILFGPSD
jgi:cell division protein FtsB